ncbi:MAG: hypothetical protein IKC18_06970 [Bacteroidaceae bacterium]|nr:hypothetical protein [Bacteroidaceae bacterium]
MGLDKTYLSKGNVYAILTNKGTWNHKGTLNAMVRDMASEAVTVIFRKVHYET